MMHRSNLHVCMAVLTAGLLLAHSGPACAQSEEADSRLRDRAVDAAIDRAARWLVDQQQKDGSWSTPHERYRQGGGTALAAWALLQAGTPSDGPLLFGVWKQLASQAPQQTPARALRALLGKALGEGASEVLHDDVRWLINAQRDDGGWPREAGQGPSTSFDTALAAWALGEARRAGMVIPDETWRAGAKFLQRAANDDGGFGHYPPGSEPVRVRGMSHGSATAAAATALGEIVQAGELQAGETQQRALAWLAEHYRLDRVPQWGWGARPDYTYRYFLGRSARPISPGRIAEDDVEESLARWLLAHQEPDGRFTGQPLAESDIIATAWALLAMTDIRRPLLANRIHFGPGPGLTGAALSGAMEWLNRERGLQVRWRDLPVEASPSQLLQAPLLVFTGTEAFALPAETALGVAEFLRLGGTVLLLPDGEAPAFRRTGDEFFRALLEGAWSEALPGDHPFFNGEYTVAPMPVTAIGGRGRKRVFLLPGSLAIRLHASQALATSDAGSLMGNIVVHARAEALIGPRFDPTLRTPSALQPLRRIQIGRLMHGGDWNTAPGATLALSRDLTRAISVGLQSRSVDAGEAIAPELRLLWLTGSQYGTLRPGEIANLRSYLDGGGMLLVDAAYGDEAFYGRALAQLEQLYGAEAIRPLPADHPLLTGTFAGELGSNLTSVAYNPAARSVLGRRQGNPSLMGVWHDGRLVAVASRLALASPTEGSPPYDCVGYSVRDARRIVLNVVLYAEAARHAAISGLK